MTSPWLNIPLADYEGHMESLEVQQLGALSDLFAEALAYCQPVSLAILGVAGGNGIDRIDSSITKRIIGIDVNPRYLEETRQRFSQTPGLELHCVDLAQQHLNLEPVQLVHTALVFEHAGVDLCLQNALSLISPNGALSVVLQLPSESAHGVGVSQFPSIQQLKSHFSLIDSTWLRQTLAAEQLNLTHESHRTLPAGKSFWLGVFRRS
jgi:hypothetical protein